MVVVAIGIVEVVGCVAKGVYLETAEFLVANYRSIKYMVSDSAPFQAFREWRFGR